MSTATLAQLYEQQGHLAEAAAIRRQLVEHLISIDGDTMRVRFNAWDAAAYDLFLRTKQLPEHEVAYDVANDSYEIVAPSRFARILGVERPAPAAAPLPFPSCLFDRQRYFVELALRAKRYALWWDTGLGKTLALLEWSRQVRHLTGGKVLIVEPLNLIPQALGEAARFYGDELSIEILETRAHLRAWCSNGAPGLAIVNPEKFLPRDGESEILAEITYCAGVALDESSCLKTGGGATKWALIKSCRGVEYKLSLTATPAPNDPIEYASQASWLEKIRDEGEVIWTFFNRDSEGEWRIKEHALAAFYRFLSGWACYVRDPEAYGFREGLANVPEAQRIEHLLQPTDEQIAARGEVADATGQTSFLEAQSLGVVERGRYAQLASGFLYQPQGPAKRIASAKPALVARLIREEVAAGRQVLVWTCFDESVEILVEELRDAPFEVTILTGRVPRAARPAIVDAYRTGAVPVLLTRAEVLGFGFNLQCTGAMVFADLDDSYERLYQGERRALRYGQTKSLRIHFPRVASLQDAVWANLEAKRAQFERDVGRMERLFIEAMGGDLEERRAA